jgi:mannose-1-phosphate guanylyltransferase/phosphomannomutase
LRHFVRKQPNTSAGIHVRLSPFDQRVVDIRIVDTKGMNQSKNAERSVERAYFREDFRRAYLDEIGVIQYPVRVVDLYVEDFVAQMDVEAVRAAHLRIVIDYSHGLAADSFAQILNKLGVDVVPLNARMDETKLAMLQNEFEANRVRMAKIVAVLEADLGIQMDVGGEKIFLVDEKGQVLDGTTAAALLLELALQVRPSSTVVTTITMPNAFDTIAGWRQGKLVRISDNLQSLMQAAATPGILMAADGDGNFIFPEFQPVVDGMMAAAKLLEFLAKYKMRVSEVVNYLPAFHIAKLRAECHAGAKGMVMRRLNEKYSASRAVPAPAGGASQMASSAEPVEGIKISLPNQEWVHLAPDPELPYFSVIAEGADQPRAAQLAEEHRACITGLLSQAAS